VAGAIKKTKGLKEKMSTINQKIKGRPAPQSGRVASFGKQGSRRAKGALGGNPFKKGICLKVMVRKPKKPNSALRKLAKLQLSNGKILTAHIPGEGHELREHNMVLVRGGRVRDLPGIKYRCVRGKFDLKPVFARRRARSKYGVSLKSLKIDPKFAKRDARP